MAAVEQPKNMKLVLDKFLCPKRVLSDGKLSLRMYNLISNPYLQYRDKDVNDMCFDASSHPSKTYFSQVVDEVKDLEGRECGEWSESIVLKSRKYKNSSKSKSYVNGYRKDRRAPPNKNKDKYVESVHLIKSLRSRNKRKTYTSLKYFSYFEEEEKVEKIDLPRVMEVEKKMIDKEKNMIELYEKIDVGFCLLLNTSLSKDVIEIIREYVYEICDECNYIDDDVEYRNFVKVFNKVFCGDCGVRLFLCICGRKIGSNGRCRYCDYILKVPNDKK